MASYECKSMWWLVMDVNMVTSQVLPQNGTKPSMKTVKACIMSELQLG